MTAALADEDRDVRAEATRRLVRVGEGVRAVVLEARSDPGMESGAMAVLARLDGAPAPEIRDYAAREVAEAARYGDLLARLNGGGDGRAAALAHAARHRSLAHGLNALTAVGGLWDEDAVAAAMENIDSRDAGQRANALETLESVGEPAIVRPLVRAWEGRPAGASDPGSAIAEGLRDGDPWVRACAAFAAGDRTGLRLVLEALARDDPDTLVRDTASAALEGDGPVETLPNLSLVERVTYLVRAPLFAKLSPSDIQRVAEIAAERAHADGDVIAEQGEPGDEMFVVVSGEIAVVLGGEGESLVEVARRGAGEAIGEMAVISHAPRMASIVATGDVRLLAIDRRRFERILRDRPDVALAVMDVLCSRLRESSGAMPHEAGV